MLIRLEDGSGGRTYDLCNERAAPELLEMQNYDITIVTIYNYLHFLYTGITKTMTVTNVRKQLTDG